MIWNMLPFEVKSSLTIKDFKINLEHFKKTNMENVGRESNAYFWKVSETRGGSCGRVGAQTRPQKVKKVGK